MLTLCRLCLSKDANFVISNGQVAARIMTCTGLEFDPDDGLPQLICHTCRLRLEEFYYFRKRCNAADRRLRYLKSLGSNANPMTTKLLECGTEDAMYLQDVANCTPTMCSENNAHWREEAAKLIRSELDAYKKELLGLCQQQVREEIEQEVRSEVEGMLLAQAQKECRVKVLDDLFYELETFFIKKRDEATFGQAYGSEGFISDSENAEVESVSTFDGQRFYRNEDATIVEGTAANNISTDGIMVLEMTEEDSELNATQMTETVCPLPTPAAPVPMVEINMENTQLSNLRDDDLFTRFLTNKTTTTTSKKDVQKPIASPSSKISKPEKPKTSLKRISGKKQCKPHVPNTNCFRCRLRGAKNLPGSVSK